MEYDEDRELTRYVWDHYRQLLTEFECRVGCAIIGRATPNAASDSAPTLICHALVGSGLGYSHRAGVAGTYERRNDDDLYSCVEQGRTRRSQSARSPLVAQAVFTALFCAHGK